MELLFAIATQINANAPYLVGLVMPIVVDYLNKDIPNEKGRFFVTILAVTVAAIATEWNALTYGSFEQVLASGGIIFAESQAIYKLYFKDSALRPAIQNIYLKKPTTTNLLEEDIVG